MVRVLQVVTYMGRGGLETMLMNYYRHIDRSRVQFDFLVHRPFEADYDAEIRDMGGKIYRVSRLIPWSRAYRAELRNFFSCTPGLSDRACASGLPERCGVAVRTGLRCAGAHCSQSQRQPDSEHKVSDQALLHEADSRRGHSLVCLRPSGGRLDVRRQPVSGDPQRH